MTNAAAITLSQDQLNLQAKAKAFAEREIKPIAAERDRIDDEMQTFPWDVWRKGARLGLRTLTLPVQYGGGGGDVLTHCVALEELCVADAAIGGAFHQVWKLQKLLLTNDYLIQNYLPKFLTDDDYMFCGALTEPDAGTDNTLPYDAPGAGAQTSAVRQPNGDWVLNGKKHFITAGGLSKGIYVLCRTDPTKGVSTGATFFFLDTSTPGFRYGHIHSKLGLRATPNAELIFEDVRVPDGQRLSEVGQGLPFAGAFGKPHAPTTAVIGIATARAAFEQTLEWVKGQTRDGKPAIEHQAVAMRLADLWAEIELARTIVWKAAWSGEHNPNHDLKLGMIAQLFGAEMVVRVCASAMQLWGDRGFRREHPIEKLYRDALGNYHLDGLNDINRLRIGRALMGRAGGGYIG